MIPPQILINQITFNLPTGKTLFNELSLTFTQHKIGLIGRNGIGKSTLLKLILGELKPTAGSIQVDGKLAYVPQHLVIYPETTIAGLLGYEEKLNALHRIAQGSINEDDFTILNEDWNLEERVQKQLAMFGLSKSCHQSLKTLSGGEITRLLLIKAFCSDADFLLLDEPTNHLDHTAKQQLYKAIQQWPEGLIVISHDRTLLNLMEKIVELTTLGTTCYGGNYDSYLEQKHTEKIAKEQHLQDTKKLLTKVKRSIQSTQEKHEQRQAHGRKLRHSGSQPKILLDAMKNRSDQTKGALLSRHGRMLEDAEQKLDAAKKEVEILDEIHVDLPATQLPHGKIILDIEQLSFAYPGTDNLIIHNFNLKMQGPERIALIGENGSGKTTLVKLILGELVPQSGKIYLGTEYISYLDQNASLLNPDLSILENFLQLNPDSEENVAYRCLAQFLFKNISALKLAKNLSGGEKLRALLACVLMSKHPPQLLILDEPTNHLDLGSIQSIESALKNYQGAMIVISHDQTFLKNISIDRYISAPFGAF